MISLVTVENIREMTAMAQAEVGRRLRTIRKAHGMSQQELADRLTAEGYEFSRLMVTKTELNTRPILISDLAAFAAVFEVPVYFFLRDETPMRLQYASENLQTLTVVAQMIRPAMKQLAGIQDHLSQVGADLTQMVDWIDWKYGETLDLLNEGEEDGVDPEAP